MKKQAALWTGIAIALLPVIALASSWVTLWSLAQLDIVHVERTLGNLTAVAWLSAVAWAVVKQLGGKKGA